MDGEAQLKLEAYRVAFGEAVRKLDGIRSTADTLRNRGTSVATAATALAAFLGGLAFDREPEGSQWWWIAVAGVLYVATLLTSLRVTSPVFARRHRFPRWLCRKLNLEVEATTASDRQGFTAELLRRIYRQAGWNSGQDTRELATAIDEQGVDAFEVYKELSISYQGYYEVDSRLIDRMARSLRRATYLMILELASLLCLLAIVAGNSPPSPNPSP